MEELENGSMGLESPRQMSALLAGVVGYEREYRKVKYRILSNLHKAFYENRETKSWPWNINRDAPLEDLILWMQQLYEISNLAVKAKAGMTLTQEILQIEALMKDRKCPTCSGKNLKVLEGVIKCSNFECGYGVKLK